MKRSLAMLTMLTVLTLTAFSQSKQPVLRISAFSASGIGDSEAAMLEKLIASYIVELKAFRVVDAQGQVMALAETEAALSMGSSAATALPLTADYIITGSLGKIGEIFILTLENTRVSTGEKLSVSDTAISISDIVLRSRDLTRSLFGRIEATPVPSATPVVAGPSSQTVTSPQPLTTLPGPETLKSPKIQDLVGSWRGDKGLETVRMFSNGTGLAVLSGGGTLKVRVSITEDTIIIIQDQPNDVVLYRGSSVTLDMAKRIATQARPMRWVFKMSSNGQNLVGTKDSIAISGSGASMVVDNTYVRDATWVRVSR